MPENATPSPADLAAKAQKVDAQEPEVTADAPAKDTPAPGEDALGDAGKQALDRMKAERATFKKERDAALEEVARAKAELAGTLDKYTADTEARRAADAKFNERVLSAEIRAAATGKLSDPADALKFLDLSKFEVGDNGEIDQAAVSAAIGELLTSKPYLAPATEARFQGSPDGGPRNAGAGQITREQLASMKPQEITAALEKGLLVDALSGKA